MRAQAARLLQDLAPGLGALEAGTGEQAILTDDLIERMKGFLDALQEADRAEGDGRLAERLEAERELAGLDELGGLTFEQALDSVDARVVLAVEDR